MANVWQRLQQGWKGLNTTEKTLIAMVLLGVIFVIWRWEVLWPQIRGAFAGYFEPLAPQK